VKALYGLKSSGLRWRERFANVLKEMGFSSSRAEPDTWMRDRGDHYEYIAVYVDDLLITSREPCWKKLLHGGWCAIISIRNPEYPGLNESEEDARWRILHWNSRLDQ
jgi:Reverse transcriptase (RNA-dependent DNA polymerase)